MSATVRYFAFTPKEGIWYFTESATHIEAINKFIDAKKNRRALSHPLNNPLSTVKAHGWNYAAIDAQGEQT